VLKGGNSAARTRRLTMPIMPADDRTEVRMRRLL
jgi:hypothetical protein